VIITPDLGLLKSPMQFGTDKNNLLYMVVPNGLGYKNVGPNEGGRAIFRFSTTEKGTLTLSFYIDAADIDNDSWHIKLDDNEFVNWNDLVTSGWQWKDFSEKYQLDAGNHILIINQREDGAKMSKISLTMK